MIKTNVAWRARSSMQGRGPRSVAEPNNVVLGPKPTEMYFTLTVQSDVAYLLLVTQTQNEN